jgi:hypothetical protein
MHVHGLTSPSKIHSDKQLVQPAGPETPAITRHSLASCISGGHLQARRKFLKQGRGETHTNCHAARLPPPPPPFPHVPLCTIYCCLVLLILCCMQCAADFPSSPYVRLHVLLAALFLLDILIDCTTYCEDCASLLTLPYCIFKRFQDKDWRCLSSTPTPIPFTSLLLCSPLMKLLFTTQHYSAHSYLLSHICSLCRCSLQFSHPTLLITSLHLCALHLGLHHLSSPLLYLYRL